MPRTPHRDLCRVSGIVLGLVLAWAAVPAVAQDAATIKKLERMNKRAMEDYDLLEFDSARKTLTDAVALVRSAGLEEAGHPIAAKTYLTLGVVYVGGFKDKDRGRMMFVRGLRIDPKAQLDAQLATPELQAVFDEARREAGIKQSGDKPPPDRPPPDQPPPDQPGGRDGVRPTGDKVEGLVHEPLSDIPAGEPVLVKAEIGPEIDAAKVILFYRGTGSAEYLLVPMTKNQHGVWIGEIPGERVAGRVLQYYIEVRDAKGRPQIANGSYESPNIASIVGGKGTRPAIDGENPLATGTRKKPDEEPPEEPKKRGRTLWITVGVGTGFGVATGDSECAWDEGPVGDVNYSGFCVIQEGASNTTIKTGIASAPLHLAPEVGFYLSQRFALSLQGRFQILTLADPGAAVGALAVLGRGLYFFGTERVRYYVSFAAGGGVIRHTVSLGAVATKADDPTIRSRDIKDTVRGGPVLFGGGGGLFYEFSRYVGLQLELNALAGVPDPTFNIDLNVGLNLNF